MDKGQRVIACLLTAIVAVVVVQAFAGSEQRVEAEMVAAPVGLEAGPICEGLDWTDVVDPATVNWLTELVAPQESCEIIFGFPGHGSVPDFDGDGLPELFGNYGYVRVTEMQLEYFMTFPSIDPSAYDLGPSPSPFDWTRVVVIGHLDVNRNGLSDLVLEATARDEKTGEERYRIFWIPNILPPPPALEGDVDGDGMVGILDLLLVLSNWT